MSDESTTDDSTREAHAQSAPDAPDEQTQDEGTPDSAQSSTERPAKYRDKLRAAVEATAAAEADRDRYRLALEPFARQQVEQAVGSRLSDPSSLWLLPDLTDAFALLDDDLALDVAKVTTAVERLLAHAPSLARRSGSADGGARSTGPASPSATWQGLLNP